MDTESFKKVEQIYHQVLNNKPDDIEQFIRDSCNNDKKIIQKVLTLLEVDEYDTFDESDDSVLQNISEIMNQQTDEFDSERYQLIKKIGQGGMGSVYLANRIDGEVEQRVAIKIINSALMTQVNINRFKKERQILARLDHINIARFIDAGSKSSGLLYVAMEYIQGDVITHYCQINKLSIKARLKIFLQLCDAIEYAHKNFIIHRDIKPTNILVNKDGLVKLLDFGIAKLFDDKEAKNDETATKIMTPAYASPEQLTGKNITVVSDIYTLGIVLFELLLGTRPFQYLEKDHHAFQTQVIAGLNSKPSLMNHSQYKAQLQGDIDAILSKVIHPETNQRYQSVLELKHDISNYLKDFPIKARTPNSWYFVKLFIKRNKLISALTTLTLLIISVFSLYSYTQNKALIKKGEELSIQRDNAIIQAKKAKLASQFLLDSFQTADPTRTFGEKLTIKQVILESYTKLKKNPIEDARLNADILLTISNAFYGMDVMDLAFESANLALTNSQGKLKTNVLLKVTLLIARAKALFAQRDYKHSLLDLHNALNLCKQNTDIKDCLLDEIYYNIAKNHGNKRQTELAIKYTKKALLVLESNSISNLRYTRKKIYFARLHNATYKPDRAIELLNEVKQRLTESDKTSKYYRLLANNMLSASYRLKKKYNIALDMNHKVLTTIEENFSTDTILYAECLRDKAAILTDIDKFNQAIEVLENSIKIKIRLKVAAEIEYNQIGWIYEAKLNQLDKSISYYQKAIEINDAVNYKSNSNAANYRRNLAFVYYHLNDYKKMLPLLLEIKEIYQSLPKSYEKKISNTNEWITFIENKLKAEN